jgi:hypothetical protein
MDAYLADSPVGARSVADGGEEVSRQIVVASGDSSEVLEATKGRKPNTNT